MDGRRVVVTGMGVVSPLGHTPEQMFENLVAGKSGISRFEAFDSSAHDTRIAGEIKDLAVTDYIEPKEARRMDRFTQLGVIAAQKCVEDSGIDLGQCDRDRFGVVLGSGVGGMQVFQRECRVLYERGPSRVSPLLIPMLISDICPGLVSIRYGLKGVNYTTVSACASAAHAIGLAFAHIRLGEADGILAGGSEAPITPIGIAGFNSMHAMSTHNDEPERASRPFDLHRDGFVMGEGGGVLLLEELEHARRRGARIYAELGGYGFSADANHITAPDPSGDGAVRSMQQALRSAGLSPESVDYINAHGTSTPLNDKTETLAIKTLFGEHAWRLSISSSKSMLGHLLGASGAAESIATIMSIQRQIVHPTANLETPDPICDLDYTPNQARERRVEVALSNSFGFGGHNVTLLFKRFAG